MNDEIDTTMLQLDIKPFKIGEYFTYYINSDFHIDYVCPTVEYEKNKDRILEEICYKLKFNRFNMPEDIQNADILLIVDRRTTKILGIIKQGFIHKDKLKDLRKIYNIDHLQFMLKNILGEEDEE